jgi:hypothetical protein
MVQCGCKEKVKGLVRYLIKVVETMKERKGPTIVLLERYDDILPTHCRRVDGNVLSRNEEGVIINKLATVVVLLLLLVLVVLLVMRRVIVVEIVVVLFRYKYLAVMVIIAPTIRPTDTRLRD